jgi:hypothetical protein
MMKVNLVLGIPQRAAELLIVGAVTILKPYLLIAFEVKEWIDSVSYSSSIGI